MTAIEEQLIEPLKKLPPSRVAEVADFVEFLSQREERATTSRRLTEGLAKLDALKLPEISEDEVEAEIQAARQERREGARRLIGAAPVRFVLDSNVLGQPDAR